MKLPNGSQFVLHEGKSLSLYAVVVIILDMLWHNLATQWTFMSKQPSFLPQQLTSAEEAIATSVGREGRGIFKCPNNT